jgi:mannose-6-phosphate isomerase-like protein (cupin superfamily)
MIIVMKHRNHYLPLIAVVISLNLLTVGSCTRPENIASGIYEWNSFKPTERSGLQVRKIIDGSTRSLKEFSVKATTLIGGYSVKSYVVEAGTDQLFIVKEGTAVIKINNRSERLWEGSVAVAGEGDTVDVMNGAKNPMTFYTIHFKPHNAIEAPGKPAFKPLFTDWMDLKFDTTATGGRRNIMREPLSALKELEIHTTQLKEGLPSHKSHIHPDEEIILVRFGTVEESVNGKPMQCGPGSVIFITNDDDHGIRNAGLGPCEYYAIRWLTADQSI